MDPTAQSTSTLLLPAQPEHYARTRPSFGPLSASYRARVDGKFFSRGKQRFRVQGTTYGPFAPDANGDQFPSLQRVKADLELMTAASINSLRLYHFPPPW